MPSVSTREDFEVQRTFGMWGHRLARQASLSMEGEEKVTAHTEAVLTEAIVEEVRGRGMSIGPRHGVHRFPGSLDEGERRMHCLRGMKPQGPESFREALTR
jgi:hypothetical protein